MPEMPCLLKFPVPPFKDGGGERSQPLLRLLSSEHFCLAWIYLQEPNMTNACVGLSHSQYLNVLVITHHVFNCSSCWAVPFDPSTQEAEAGGSL